MLGHLYPQISTLESAVQILTGPDRHSPFVFPTEDAQTYLITCRETLVACNRVGQLEAVAGRRGALFCGYETRRRVVERKNPSLMLKSVVTAVKNVS